MKVLITLFTFCFSLSLSAQNTSPYWSLSGNSNASTSSKLGTTNAAPLRLVTNNSERLRIDSIGQVSIGLTTAFARLTAWNNGSTPSSVWKTGTRSIFMGFGENTSGSSDLLLSMASNTSASRSVFIGRRSRGTLAAPASIAQNDLLLSLLSSAYDGKSFQNAATIDFVVDGTPALGKVPTKLSFVTGTRSADRKERMSIGSNGDVAISNQALFSTLPAGQQNINLNNGQLKMISNGNLSSTGSNIEMFSKNVTIGDYGPAGIIPNCLVNIDGEDVETSLGIWNFDNGTGIKIDAWTGIDIKSRYDGMTIYSQSGDGININVDESGTGININAPIGIKIEGAEGVNFRGGGAGLKAHSRGTAIDVYGAENGIFSKTIGNWDRLNYDEPTNSFGIYGENSNGAQNEDSRHIGVAGVAAGAGVYGYSTGFHGVYGTTTAANAYAGYFAGRVFGSGGFFTTSDSKLKKDIKELPKGLDIIRQLKPRTYEYRQDGNYGLMNLPKGQRYGLVAQELEQVLPGLVQASEFQPHLAQKPEIPDSSGAKNISKKEAPINYKAVNYTELIPILVKGIQEQDEKIANQEQQIGALTHEVSELKALVNKLINGSSAPVGLSNASLGLANPNPVNGSTLISYNVPQGSKTAHLLVTDMKGSVVKQILLNSRGSSRVTLNTAALAAGTYTYSLHVDGSKIDSKQLLIAR